MWVISKRGNFFSLVSGSWFCCCWRFATLARTGGHTATPRQNGIYEYIWIIYMNHMIWYRYTLNNHAFKMFHLVNRESMTNLKISWIVSIFTAFTDWIYVKVMAENIHDYLKTVLWYLYGFYVCDLWKIIWNVKVFWHCTFAWNDDELFYIFSLFTQTHCPFIGYIWRLLQEAL